MNEGLGAGRLGALQVLSERIERMEAHIGRLKALRDVLAKAQALRRPDAPPDSDASLLPFGNGSPAEIALWDIIVSAKL